MILRYRLFIYAHLCFAWHNFFRNTTCKWGGYVYAQTHTGLANDLVQGVGNQTYIRIYSSEPGETSLKSKL